MTGERQEKKKTPHPKKKKKAFLNKASREKRSFKREEGGTDH